MPHTMLNAPVKNDDHGTVWYVATLSVYVLVYVPNDRPDVPDADRASLLADASLVAIYKQAGREFHSSMLKTIRPATVEEITLHNFLLGHAE